MAKTRHTQHEPAEQDEILTSADLVPGKTLKRGEDKLTIRSVEKHYGNIQVRYYSTLDQKEQWDQIGKFLESISEAEAA